MQTAEGDVVLCSEYLSVVTESLKAKRVEKTWATQRVKEAREARENRRTQLRLRRRAAARARARRRTANAVLREASITHRNECFRRCRVLYGLRESWTDE